MEALAEALQKIKADLSNPDLYSHHSESLSELMKEESRLEKELAEAEDAWLKAEELGK